MPEIASSLAVTARGPALARLVLYSLFGLFVFFVPIEIAGRSTIPLDHAATALVTHARPVALAFVCLLIAYGAAAPLLDGSWRKSPTARVFTGLKLLGLLLTAGYLAGIGPAALYAPDMLPFLFDKLVLSVGLIVPIGALALGFLVGFGLLELTGVLVQRVMRPVWRTPGWSAIDAVASFVGSYSLALLITDRVFRDGKYTVREAVIIATGFSTVSATFMVIVAKTLGLMEVWNLYFWSTLVVTFTVTAITARLWPISGLPQAGGHDPALPQGRSRLQAALDAGIGQARQAPALPVVLRENLDPAVEADDAALLTDAREVALHAERLLLAGQDAGAFRPGITAVDLLALIVSLCFFRVGNGVTAQHLSRVDLESRRNVDGMRRMVIDTVLAFLTSNISYSGYESYLEPSPAPAEAAEPDELFDIYGEDGRIV